MSRPRSGASSALVLLLSLLVGTEVLPVAAGHAAPDARELVDVPSGGSVAAVAGIDPPALRAGLRAGVEDTAIVVLVHDPEEACKRYDCVKLFESRRTKALKSGMRAILVIETGQAASAGAGERRATLLWGSPSVLLLQPDRSAAESAHAWKLVAAARREHDKAYPGFELLTEAAHGVVTADAAGFHWTETAD